MNEVCNLKDSRPGAGVEQVGVTDSQRGRIEM